MKLSYVRHTHPVCPLPGPFTLIIETLFNKLTEYEQTGVDFYTNNDKKKCVLTNPNHEYETMMEHMPQRLGNPYTQIIEWIKREIYDL